MTQEIAWILAVGFAVGCYFLGGGIENAGEYIADAIKETWGDDE